MKKECRMQHNREDNNREGKSITATIVERMGMACTTVHTLEDILVMAKEEAQEDKLLHLETGPKHLLHLYHQSSSLEY